MPAVGQAGDPQNAAAVAMPPPVRLSNATAANQAFFTIGAVSQVRPLPNGSREVLPPQPVLMAAGMTLRELIRFAYAGINGPLMPGQTIGGAAWVDAQRYDIAIPVGESDLESLSRDADGIVVGGSALGRLQKLLAERFALKVHTEVRAIPVYKLVVSTGTPGPDLKPSHATCQGSALENRCEFQSGPGFWSTQGKTMAQVVFHLSWRFPVVARPVRDETGLKGKYDFSISFTPAFLYSARTGSANVPNLATAAGGSGSLFSALEERLGLTLLEQVDSVDVLVIDSAQPLTN
jgi:uncharacterized protein (TIGR03435 family)